MSVRHLLTTTALAIAGLAASGTVQSQPNELPEPRGTVQLIVAGQIDTTNQGDEAHLDDTLLENLTRHELETSTSVTDGVNHFEGFLMRDLLERLGAEGDTAAALALNDYLIEIPMQDFHDYDVLVADTMDGEALSPRDKGPLWIVYPRDDHPELQDIRYDYRWVWQLYHLEIQ